MRLPVACVLILSSFGCESVREVPVDERLKLYNEVLDQVISDNYYGHCLPADALADSALVDFQRGKITQAKYVRIGDSLQTIRKGILPKCVLEYTNAFQIFRNVHELPDDIKAAITERLKDKFVEEHFEDDAIATVTDSISRPAPFHATQLAVGYLDIKPYGKRADRPFGEGMGVLALSSVYFNMQADKAILFYEFNCGPKCGVGDVVFLEKVLDRWKVVEYKRVWES